jgi:hypothetical protein
MLDAAGECALVGGFALAAGGSRALAGALLNARKRHKIPPGESGQETDPAVGVVELCFLTFAAVMFLISLVLLLLSMFA